MTNEMKRLGLRWFSCCVFRECAWLTSDYQVHWCPEIAHKMDNRWSIEDQFLQCLAFSQPFWLTPRLWMWSMVQLSSFSSFIYWYCKCSYFSDYSIFGVNVGRCIHHVQFLLEPHFDTLDHGSRNRTTETDTAKRSEFDPGSIRRGQCTGCGLENKRECLHFHIGSITFISR